MSKQISVVQKDQGFISIKELKCGSVVAHRNLSLLFFQELQQWAVARVKLPGEAYRIVCHVIIKYWLRSSNLQDRGEVAAFLFNTIQNLCRSFLNRQVDCPSVREVMLDQILTPEVREGKTAELLLAELGAVSGEDLERARSVFRLRYARYYWVGDVSKEIGLTESEVGRYERMALQLLHLVLVP